MPNDYDLVVATEKNDLEAARQLVDAGCPLNV